MSSDDASSAQDGPPLPTWARLLDGLAIALLVLAAYIKIFGGVRIEIGVLPISLRTPWKLVAECVVIMIVRHLLRPQPNALRHFLESFPAWRQRALHVGQSILGSLPNGFWPAVAIFLATRLTVLLVGYVGVIQLGYPRDAPIDWRASDDELLNLPARWDTGWYLGIAMNGYDPNPATGQTTVAFFPAFPALMRVVAQLIWADTTDPAKMIWAGTIVSLCAFFAALVYLFNLMRDKLGEQDTIFGLTLLASYPFAVFFSTAYTESLFLLAASATFFHFYRRQWMRAMVWGLLGGLVRPNGWTLSAPLALAAIAELTAGRAPMWTRWFGGTLRPAPGEPPPHRLRLALAVTAPVIGLLMHSGYLYWLTGDPLAWARVMKYWNRDYQGLTMIGRDIDYFVSLGFVEYVTQRPADLLNALGLLLALVSVAPVTRRLGLAYGLFVLINISLPAVSGGLVSIGRYSSVLFPSFFWLAAATPAAARPALVSLFALGQGLAAILFFTWRSLY